MSVTTDFNAALANVLSDIGEKTNREEILSIIYHHLFDETRFNKSKRPSALKKINEATRSRFTMNDVRHAGKKPEKLIVTDKLSGQVDIPVRVMGEVNEQVSQAETVPVTPTETDAMTHLENTMKEENQPLAQQLLERSQGARAAYEEQAGASSWSDSNDSDEVVEVLGVTFKADNILSYTIDAWLINGGLPTHLKTELEELVKSQDHSSPAGALRAFLDDHPELSQEFINQYSKAVKDINATGVEAEKARRDAAKAQRQAPGTFKERVVYTLRGGREEGFGSGAVAAAAAIIGGGVEMASRGNVSIGSVVGTGLGAAAGYFAAEKAEGLMKSEPGRYIVSGSIGLILGGAGSNLGRTTQGLLGFGPQQPQGEPVATVSVREQVTAQPEPVPQSQGILATVAALF
ncbi:hypothetical protein [Pseudomonas phage IR-QUMS-PaBa1-GHS-2021]|nr:hypothetical protein [Pseudomonas phage IR-QUMS-PaBa1-GHS-2021]